MQHIYLDYAAATPMDPKVLQAMEPYFSQRFYNPSSAYMASRTVKKDIDAARSRVALCLGARSKEVLFTAGGTEANNIAIHGIMRAHPEGSMVVSAIEHASVLEPAKKYDCRVATVGVDGIVIAGRLAEMIDDSTVLISIGYANNEIGTIQPMSDVVELVSSVRKDRLQRGITRPLYFHTDACQAGSYLDLHVSRLGVDLMTLNGGKIYGPKQSGVLYVRSGVEIESYMQGGAQERGLRSGTENAAAIVGFATALDIAQVMRKSESARLRLLQKNARKALLSTVSGSAINGNAKRRLPNNLNIIFPGVDGERLIMELDEQGVQAATGSACSASKDGPSHVLLALGLPLEDASASLRLSFGRGTTPDQIDAATRIISRTVQRLRGNR